MLKINNLKSGYDNMEILHGIDIEVKPTEIVALIGPNGAGKSTLIKSIFRLADVSSGSIIFGGKDITRVPTHEIIKLGISYAPQGRQIFSNMTVLENLEMGTYILNDRVLSEKRINDILNLFPILKEKKHQNSATLSGGQQQSLSIARALVQKPKLLLLDEPSLGLSPQSAKDLFSKIVDIRDQGISIILVEQNAKQAISIADRTYLLENGIVALEGDNTIVNSPILNKVYFGG